MSVNYSPCFLIPGLICTPERPIAFKPRIALAIMRLTMNLTLSKMSYWARLPKPSCFTTGFNSSKNTSHILSNINSMSVCVLIVLVFTRPRLREFPGRESSFEPKNSVSYPDSKPSCQPYEPLGLLLFPFLKATCL